MDDFDEWLRAERVTDHPHWGNVCSGFGGDNGCKQRLSTGEKCGKPPLMHQYIPRKHTLGPIHTDLSVTPVDYQPRHRLRR